MNQTFFTTEQLSQFENVSFRYIEVARNGFLYTLTLNRPEKRNAFNPQMADEIVFALEYADRDESVRCIVIKAAGPVFCAGADLNSFLSTQIGDAHSVPRPSRTVNLGEAFANLCKPSVAQVEGSVFAGGFLILAGATFAYSIPEAQFSLPEVKRGIWPMQVMASLCRIMPQRKVLEMCITAKNYSTAEAMGMGLISGIFPTDRIDEEVDKLAAVITENAPLAISRGMRALGTLFATDDTPVYRRLQTELDLLLHTEDATEGISAFKEKRKPQWKNR